MLSMCFHVQCLGIFCFSPSVLFVCLNDFKPLSSRRLLLPRTSKICQKQKSLRLFKPGFCPLKYQVLFLLANCLLVLLAREQKKSHRATSKAATQAASAGSHSGILRHPVTLAPFTRTCDTSLICFPLQLKLQRSNQRGKAISPKSHSYLLSFLSPKLFCLHPQLCQTAQAIRQRRSWILPFFFLFWSPVLQSPIIEELYARWQLQ